MSPQGVTATSPEGAVRPKCHRRSSGRRESLEGFCVERWSGLLSLRTFYVIITGMVISCVFLSTVVI